MLFKVKLKIRAVSEDGEYFSSRVGQLRKKNMRFHVNEKYNQLLFSTK